MKVEIFYTKRYFNNWPTCPLIYEWEDVIARPLNLQLVDSLKVSVTTFYLNRILRFTSSNIFGCSRLIIFADKLINKRAGPYFELLPRSSFPFTGSKNTVPINIDFSKNIDLNLFYNAHRNGKVVFISNLHAFNYLEQSKCLLNIYHFPQNIADIYKITADTSLKKTFNMIIPGRFDFILVGFLKENEQKFLGIEYLYREYTNGEYVYISNETGPITWDTKGKSI